MSTGLRREDSSSPIVGISQNRPTTIRKTWTTPPLRRSETRAPSDRLAPAGPLAGPAAPDLPVPAAPFEAPRAREVDTGPPATAPPAASLDVLTAAPPA
ncbi:hypothetical protein Sm713_20620 [Streptomyces sp. TS71-3]|nr:hypothetical protein Sm713_20620 [Streptomyces sp. TS71-3]